MNCINKIMDYYQNEGAGKTLDSEEVKVWFSHMLRNLMKNTIKSDSTDTGITNCIILMIILTQYAKMISKIYAPGVQVSSLKGCL